MTNSMPRGGRAFSALELALGAAIVLGHNVFRVVPNEVPILFVLGLLSLKLRDGSLAAIFRRPPSWTRIVLIALGAAVLRVVLGDYVIIPLTSEFWPEPAAPEGVDDIAGDVRTALLYLLLVWTFAAFGEEIAYRGYLLTRAADLGHRSAAAYLAGIVVVAVLFGYGHYYKGPAGILDSGIAGLILGGAYLVAGRNLWASVLAHGFIDTYAVFLSFVGWET